MPNKVNLQAPPMCDDRTLYSFLWKLIEQLNVCLNQIDEDNLADGVREKLNRVFDLADAIDTTQKSADGQVTLLSKATQQAVTESQKALNKNLSETETALQKSIDANTDSITALNKTHTDDVSSINSTITGLKKVYAAIDHTHSLVALAEKAYAITTRSTGETDLDNIKTAGQYWLNSSFANNPTGGNALLLVLCSSSNSYNFQIVIDTNASDIYARFHWSFTDEHTWTSWFKFTGTAVTA